MIWVLYMCSNCKKQFPTILDSKPITCCGPIVTLDEVLVDYEKVKRPSTKQYSKC